MIVQKRGQLRTEESIDDDMREWIRRSILFGQFIQSIEHRGVDQVLHAPHDHLRSRRTSLHARDDKADERDSSNSRIVRKHGAASPNSAIQRSRNGRSASHLSGTHRAQCAAAIPYTLPER